MANNIRDLKVTPEELRTEAGHIYELVGEEIYNIFQDMINSVNDVRGIFQSGAMDKFYNEMEDKVDDMNDLLGFISDYVQDLQDIAKTYEDAEKDVEGVAGALVSNVVEKPH